MILLDIDPELIQLVQKRADKEKYPDISTLVRMLLFHYATYKDQSAGGRKRAANMTAAERTTSAQIAALTRWGEKSDEEKREFCRKMSDARWGRQRRVLATARRLLSPSKRLVPGWPLMDGGDDDETEDQRRSRAGAHGTGL